MEYVQLIEKVDLKEGVWVTFWSVTENMRLSMEIGSPGRRYEIGEVFAFNREGKREQEVLSEPDIDAVRRVTWPLPLPSRLNLVIAKIRHRLTFTSGAAGSTSAGSLVLLDSHEPRRLVS